MSLSSTSSATGSATARRAVRAAVAVAVAVALLTPVAVLFTQVWSGAGDRQSFAAYERRGVAYLGPLTRLLSATTDIQSAAVRGKPIDPTAVRGAIAEVDGVDARLGAELRTTERWTTIRGLLQELVGRRWNSTTEAYTQFSDLVTQLMELNRTVGDASRLVLDPELDSYYVMNAVLLRIPEILVDTGRYTDLSVLAAEAGSADPASAAQLTAARNRVATHATDLNDGLLKAFGSTNSSSLGAALTRPLDDFRTAVDAVAPSNSLLAPPPERSPSDLETDRNALQQAGLGLQNTALAELDRLLGDREGAAGRTRLIAAGAALLGLLMAGAAAVMVRPQWLAASGPDTGPGSDPGPGAGERSVDRHAAADPARRWSRADRDRAVDPAGDRRPARTAPGQPPAGRPGVPDPAPGLVGAAGPEPWGGARAPR